MPTWREHIDINLAWRVALCAVAAVVVGLGLTWPGHRFSCGWHHLPHYRVLALPR